MSDQRFDKIETALTRLSEDMSEVKQVVVALARMEEKHIATQQRLDSHDTRLNKHSEEIDNIQVTQAAQQTTTSNNEWIIRTALAGIASLIVYLLAGQ